MKLVFKLVAIALFFLLAIGMLIGASIWEGTAAVAPDGVLPHTGYYAATNAFPRDTVVIVANLENGKTIQVAVAAALDNSSVLILLSREAADAIALSANYPGRVRLMEAIDPVTMLPPMENKISNGDPDYDPMARISSASPNSPAPALADEGGVPAEEVVAEDDAPSPLPEEGDALVFVEAGGVPAEEGATEDDAPPPLPEGGDAPVLAEAGGVPADAE
ncbi:MAG: septal ring lytic transglycosylase RlpA family protein, partial [Treponema sp.]|nr:septal ring lytic transglycosylase RlpA family protein [Treponema sp.]